MALLKTALSWVFILLFCAVLPHLSTFIHEMGHFLFDKISGMHVNLVSIGKGDLLFTFTLLDTPIEIYKSWGGGFVDSYQYKEAWQNFIAYSAGVVFGLSALLLATYPIQKVAGYGLSFKSFIFKLPIKAFYFALYLFFPIFLAIDYMKKAEADIEAKEYFQFFYYLYENGKNRYFIPLAFVFSCLIVEIANVVPGFYGDGGDGVPALQALLEVFGYHYTTFEIAQVGIVVLPWTPYFLVANFILAFVYVTRKFSNS
ncbi:MAG: hypothetical protein ACI9TY_000782 [Alphaproteobacteria bacterium]|jgi:hypothetical protein